MEKRKVIKGAQGSCFFNNTCTNISSTGFRCSIPFPPKCGFFPVISPLSPDIRLTLIDPLEVNCDGIVTGFITSTLGNVSGISVTLTSLTTGVTFAGLSVITVTTDAMGNFSAAITVAPGVIGVATIQAQSTLGTISLFDSTTFIVSCPPLPVTCNCRSSGDLQPNANVFTGSYSICPECTLDGSFVTLTIGNTFSFNSSSTTTVNCDVAIMGGTATGTGVAIGSNCGTLVDFQFTFNTLVGIYTLTLTPSGGGETCFLNSGKIDNGIFSVC